MVEKWFGNILFQCVLPQAEFRDLMMLQCTVISNWCAGNPKTEEWAKTIQVFEVTPDKKIVWALSAWNKPDLGLNTYIQLLDQIGNPDNGELQR